ncbi:hypothetical protein VTK73DRAFT_7782 [Phialemonium thermophilum]|uniref:Uncharacterized protein n=1 Tax=Phialemonium thermophilum TaxID=223376 RepID=A0ABR3WCT0_9PEZI
MARTSSRIRVLAAEQQVETGPTERARRAAQRSLAQLREELARAAERPPQQPPTPTPSPASEAQSASGSEGRRRFRPVGRRRAPGQLRHVEQEWEETDRMREEEAEDARQRAENAAARQREESARRAREEPLINEAKKEEEDPMTKDLNSNSDDLNGETW